MNKLAIGNWVFIKRANCSGLITKKVSKYYYLARLVALADCGLPQVCFVSNRQVKNGDVILYETN